MSNLGRNLGRNLIVRPNTLLNKISIFLILNIENNNYFQLLKREEPFRNRRVRSVKHLGGSS